MVLPDEKHLAEIADLARELVLALPPEDIFEIHFDALIEIGRERKTLLLQDVSNGLAEVVLELIMGIGLSYREELFKRSQAEQALRVSERRFRAIAESALDALISCDMEGNVVFWNLGAEKIFGYPASEMIGKKVLPLFQADHHETVSKIVFGQDESLLGSTLALEAVRHDGAPLALEGVFSRWHDQHEFFVSMVLRDLTDRKATEKALETAQERLQLSQRLESVGRLAGGVAHDFNNVLTAILGECDLILAKLNADDPLREDIASIQQAGHRASRLTRQLLAFGRKQILNPQPMLISQVIDNAKRMLSRVLPENIEIRIVQDPELGAALVDPAQIEQVLLNLCLNARDAMREGGMLRIQTENIAVHEHSIARLAIEQMPPGAYVLLSVQDTGSGMSPETLSRIFEPFFTTKPVGEGTGLGLPSVYGIVKQSGGFIWVESAIGVGTTFRLYFPRVEFVPSHSSVSETVCATKKGGEIILLVEDNDAVRRLTRKLLLDAGFVVVSAVDADAALLNSRSFAGKIDLLLTDVVMPKMNGRELAKILREERAELRVLFMSGYTGDSADTDPLLGLHGVEQSKSLIVLEKPFNRETLVKKVREVLDAESEA